MFPRVEGEDGPTAEVEDLRGQLARILVDVVPDGVDQRYGTTSWVWPRTHAGSDVVLDSGARGALRPGSGAEGRSSRTRRLAFAEQTRLRDHGVTITYGTVDREAADGDTWDWFTATDGRVASIRRTTWHDAGQHVLRDRRPVLRVRAGRAAAGPAERRFAGAGWQTERILAGFRAAPEEFYVQRMEAGRRRPLVPGPGRAAGRCRLGFGSDGHGDDAGTAGCLRPRR